MANPTTPAKRGPGRPRKQPVAQPFADVNGDELFIDDAVQVSPQWQNAYPTYAGRVGRVEVLELVGDEKEHWADVQFPAGDGIEPSYTPLLTAHLEKVVPPGPPASVTPADAPPAAHALQYVPLAHIDILSNTRSSYDEASLEELAASIRQYGVMQNVLLRPHPEQPGRYQLAAGHRRYLASQRAERFDIPAAIREMDDHEFLEIQTLENLQREALNPADEAQAFAMLLANEFTAEEIGLRIGKNAAFVAQRASLAKLVPELAEILRSGKLHVGAALLLARHPALVQQKIVQDQVSRSYETTITLGMARNWVQRHLRELSRAPFSLTDPTLNPVMGACTGCPQRTSAQTLLFPDLADSDCCLNEACYATKVANHITQAAAAAEEEFGIKPLLIANGYSEDKTLLHRAYYREVEPGATGAVPAVFADSREGEVVFVKVSGNGGEDSPETKAERKKQLDATILKNNIQRRTNWLIVEALATELRSRGPWRELLEELVRRELDSYGGPSRPQRAWLHKQFGFPDHEAAFDGRQSIANYLMAGIAEQTDEGLLTLIIMWSQIKNAHFEYPTSATKWAEAGGRIDVAKLRQQAERELAAPRKPRSKPKPTVEELTQVLDEAMGKEGDDA